MQNNDKLTSRQQMFVDAYTGDATAAAIAAGYSAKTATEQGSRLLTNVKVAKAIEERRNKEVEPLIARRKDRQKLWTAVMLDEKEKMRDRLRASELLGKSEGDFIERRDISIRDKITGDNFDVSKLSEEELDELIQLGEDANAGES